MRKFFTLFTATVITTSLMAQEDTTKAKELDQVVVTGQYKPQSLKSSVYQVRVINNERIRLSGATNVQQVLNTQLGFRFSNDNILGVSDVSLMGMTARNIKILLDGVPLTDRNDARESINQIDINTIERIEIVDGPMSVSYGSDALAGVINIITKINKKDNLSVFAKAQEETAGSEYYPFSYKGVHTQNIGINFKKKSWNTSVGGTHNDFDGFGGDAYGRGKTWRPKEQWMENVKLGYSNNGFDIYYRLDALNETITDREPINMLTYRAINKKYVTDRYIHQLQSGWNINNKLQLNSVLSYTDYKRKTTTTIRDFEKDTETLTNGDGEQDLAKLNSFLFRTTLQYKASEKLSFQPGVEIQRQAATSGRIEGKPVITDYALFVSSEIKPTSKINIRPGLRFIHNSTYSAPPVVPSVNTKFVLSKTLDLRLAYAHGFRAPQLRELYFLFVDANHDIHGNPDLEAEHSNSFTGSLSYTPPHTGKIIFTSALAGFYNLYDKEIVLTSDANNPNRYSYFNIDKAKTTGGTLENKLGGTNFDATLGFSYIGFYSSANDDNNYIKEDGRNFLWTPEINSSIIYRIPKLKTSFSLFYKYTGKKPAFEKETNTLGQNIIYVAQTSSYNIADFTITSAVYKYITVSAGIRNIFDVTNINNTAVSSGIHTSGGPLAMGYGRSYFLGLSFQWNKK